MPLEASLQVFVTDQKRLIELGARIAGIKDPVAVDPDSFKTYLIKKSIRGPVFPLDGLLIRDWDPNFRRHYAGVHFGVRTYRIEEIAYAIVEASTQQDFTHSLLRNFMLVARQDYQKLYKIAYRLSRELDSKPQPPVLEGKVRKTLWDNSIGYLESKNLKRIREYGGRLKRGLLLYGPPGNGKTSACRWLRHECLERGWDWTMVTAEAYQTARQACNPVEAIRELFSIETQGIIFFDDMDMALRNREDAPNSDDQSIFLNALDGITMKESIVFIFATNCPLDRIDPAFRRPGRVDVSIAFPKPNRELRKDLISLWHPETRAALDLERVQNDTDGMSFAEIEELRNLLVLQFVNANEWNWDWAMEQFRKNREELGLKKPGPLGYAVTRNGSH